MTDVSVIVPTHNRSGMLPGLFASLATQTLPPDLWELVVVNDGSKDDTFDVLGRLAATLPVNVMIVDQEQRGSAAARNSGMERASGRILLFLDDDMIALPALLAAHVSAHSSDHAAVVGRIGTPAGPRDPWTAWEDAKLAEHAKSMSARPHALGPRDFYSGNCSLPADLLRSLKGFNADLMRTDDFELGYRLKAAGASFVYSPEAESIHIGTHVFETWLENARALGASELVLGWNLGHDEIQAKVFEWYLARHVLTRALVRLCGRQTRLETPLIAWMNRIGQAAHARGAHSVRNAAYSAIFNLAYWMRILDGLGPGAFFREVRRAKTLPASQS